MKSCSKGASSIAANLWVKGRHVGHVEFGALGKGLSPFPFMLIFAQDEHERLLIERLSQVGVTVERPTEFIELQRIATTEFAPASAAPNGVEETCTADYVAGCDGAHSTVRNVMDAGFPGGTYDHLFYVADVAATGPVMNGELHVALDEADFLAVFPLHDDGHARLVGIVRTTNIARQTRRSHRGTMSAQQSSTGSAFTVDRVHWFSTYHVHHRVAEHFQKGRIFLLGDAAHIHSPVGGQGMNTGIGDAVNLAWKLADVLHNRAAPKLLDTYEPERIAFASALVASTDRLSHLSPAPADSPASCVPSSPPVYSHCSSDLGNFRRLQFRTVSQIAINYRHSPLSHGQAGKIKAGDRLPWVAPSESPTATDNFTPLESPRLASPHLRRLRPQHPRILRAMQPSAPHFEWTTQAATAGLDKSALYLIRPDGYIAFADADPSVAALDNYLKTLR